MVSRLEQAVEHHRAGRLSQAEAIYREVVAAEPRQAGALYLLGLLLHGRGAVEEAEGFYRRALEWNPAHAEAHAKLGVLVQARGERAEAEACCRRAVRLEESSAAAHLDLGLVLRAQGRNREAEACLRRALELDSGHPQALAALAEILVGRGDAQEAEAAARKALEREPENPAAHNNLGVVLLATNRGAEAAACFERAIQLSPDYADAHAHLGLVHQHQLRFDEAEVCHRQALAANPRHALALDWLGNTLKDQGRAEEAVECYRKAREVDPSPGLAAKLALTLPVIMDSRDEMLSWRERFQQELDKLLNAGLRLKDPSSEVNASNFYLAYHGMNDRPLLEKVARFYRQACPSLGWQAPLRPRQGRMRVGFLSKYLYKHTIGKLYRGLIERLSRERFEVVVFQLGPQDWVSEAIGRSADRRVVLAGSLARLREQVAAEGLDVLFYPDVGMCSELYYLAYARLARVQCVSWGHPVTTGLDSIDYFLSSEGLETAGAEEHYTERLIRFRKLPCYYYRPMAFLAGRSQFGLEEDWKVYLCPQTLFKLHPDFDPIFREILERDERGRLVLIRGVSRHWTGKLRARLERTLGRAAERVLFIERVSQGQFPSLLAGADAILDTAPFGGGNTSYEAFAVGAPIVTWPGEFLRGRVTAACYRQMGVDEGVVSSAREYVETALRLANDRDWRQDLGRRIRERSAALYEDREALAEMEQFLEAAVKGAEP